ncbi:MAG TPA: hypothetical protein VFE24_15875 [Pirellulales bacterium]|jgi:hypothetical protein|nr:hypothetical protein [Pirellulales bacterium]
MPNSDRPLHGHHKIAAAIFVGSLILGSAFVLSAELMKPERYEFHPAATGDAYVIYDRDTGRAIRSEFNAPKPLSDFSK